MRFAIAGVVALCAATLAAGVNAQSGGAMAHDAGAGSANQDNMSKTDKNDVTYTGCVAAAQAKGTFVLTHVVAGDGHMGMGKDAMRKEPMAKDGTGADTMGRSPMSTDAMSKDAMSKDHMAPDTLRISSAKLDLGKELGHKVTVVGTPSDKKMDAMEKDAPGFTVKTLKVIANSCQ